MNTFKLSIISPEGKIFDGDAVSITAQGIQGELGVMARHTPIVVQLKEGITKVTLADKTEFFQTQSGVLEVDAEHNVLLLTDHVEKIKNSERDSKKPT